MIKYSVIIPVFNTISECFNIINAFNDIIKDRRDIELIIIDDGSIGGSSEHLFGQRNILYIYIPNHGVSYARNLGMTKARGQYVLFWDSDDRFDFNVFDFLDKNIKSHHEFIGLNYKKIDQDNNIKIYKNKTQEFTIDDFTKGVLTKKYNINICASVFKLSVIKEHNILFETGITHCEDILFILNYINKISNPVLFDFFIFEYLYRSNSAMNSFITSSNLSIFTALELMYDIYHSRHEEYIIYYIKSHYTLFMINLIKSKISDSNIVDDAFIKFHEIKSKVSLKNEKYSLLYLLIYNKYTLLFIKKYIKFKCAGNYLC